MTESKRIFIALPLLGNVMSLTLGAHRRLVEERIAAEGWSSLEWAPELAGNHTISRELETPKRYDPDKSWATKYRGPLLIHAGKTVDRDYMADPEVEAMLRGCHIETGAVIAKCVLSNVHQTEDISRLVGVNERLCGDFTPGRFAWELVNIEPLDEPIPCAGHQGLWTPGDDILAQLPAVPAPAMAALL